MNYERELREALATAAAAGRFARTEYDTFTPIPDAPANISTHVDRGCQEIILKHLRAAFPDDGIVAEENTPTVTDAPTGADRTWVVDPIDGTRGFAMKNGEFSVMVGLTVGGVPVVGVVLEPTRDRVTFAVAGGGCWVRVGDGEPVRCRASDRADVADAVLVESWGKPSRPPKPIIKAIAPAKLLATYSAGIKLAMVARGEADLYVNDYAGFKDWDVCAGHVLIEEAGGMLTEFGGGSIQYGRPEAVPRRGLIASNGKIHAEVVRRVLSVL